jgi:phosphatidylglycerophosphatase A
MLGIGNLPISGTLASFVTVAIYFLFFSNFNIFFFFILIFLLGVYSFYYLDQTINKYFVTKDPKEIVIDEFLGQSIPLLLCGKEIFLILLSFLIFRAFDILKPWPCNYFDQRHKNAFGVILDDVIAGFYTFLVIYLCL